MEEPFMGFGYRERHVQQWIGKPEAWYETGCHECPWQDITYKANPADGRRMTRHLRRHVKKTGHYAWINRTRQTNIFIDMRPKA